MGLDILGVGLVDGHTLPTGLFNSYHPSPHHGGPILPQLTTFVGSIVWRTPSCLPFSFPGAFGLFPFSCVLCQANSLPQCVPYTFVPRWVTCGDFSICIILGGASASETDVPQNDIPLPGAVPDDDYYSSLLRQCLAFPSPGAFETPARL